MQIFKPLILASRSPRRIELLKQIGLHPTVIPSHIPEDINPALTPAENAKQLALKKAEEVASEIDNAIVIGADTIVVLEGMLLGKPETRDDAKRMLRLLSGKTHTVVTGFALLDVESGEWISECESTLVTFRELPDLEIDEYVAGGSPMDKAGAYGIQDDYGAVFVTRIEGCFYNVVGFPLSAFYTALLKFQIQLTERKGMLYVEKD